MYEDLAPSSISGRDPIRLSTRPLSLDFEDTVFPPVSTLVPRAGNNIHRSSVTENTRSFDLLSASALGHFEDADLNPRPVVTGSHRVFCSKFQYALFKRVVLGHGGSFTSLTDLPLTGLNHSRTAAGGIASLSHVVRVYCFALLITLTRDIHSPQATDGRYVRTRMEEQGASK